MTRFKAGDKVRYKESEKRNANGNGHSADAIYTIKSYKNGCVYFKGHDNHCMLHRLELVEPQEETFDYKQALKILAENPETNIQMLSAGRLSDCWIDIKGFGSITINTSQNSLYRITPNKPTFHWLIKSKGKFAVTSQKYTSEEDVKAGYSYPVKVIQNLED